MLDLIGDPVHGDEVEHLETDAEHHRTREQRGPRHVRCARHVPAHEGPRRHRDQHEEHGREQSDEQRRGAHLPDQRRDRQADGHQQHERACGARCALGLARARVPHEGVDDAQHLEQRSGGEEEREPGNEEREDPLPGREVADPRERLGRQPADPRVARQAPRILARGTGSEAEDHDEQEHVRDHEEEHPERHRAREHPSTGRDVALERTERGVDDLGVRTFLLELFARALDATDGPRLLQPQSLHPRLRDRGVGVVFGRPFRCVVRRAVRVGHRSRTASMRPSATARPSAAWSATVWSA